MKRKHSDSPFLGGQWPKFRPKKTKTRHAVEWAFTIALGTLAGLILWWLFRWN